MADILQEIVAHKRIELEDFKRVASFGELMKAVEPLVDKAILPYTADIPVPSMRQALLDSDSGVIAEFKRKSPSKGWIKEDGKADVIPLAYQQSGAAAISVLTDTRYFGGCDDFLKTARKSGVTIPVIYKNFVVDEYQLLQARLSGASAVLLIAACLTKAEYRGLLRKAHDLQLEVLLEMHGDEELKYADTMPDMCGINNRDLGTFVTNVGNSFRLAERLPADACRVSESGISDPETVRGLRKAGFNGFLIGENFMKTAAPGEALREFIKEIKD